MDSFSDRLSKAELEMLAAHAAPGCVSIQFSPPRASREVRQDAIRLRNLLDAAGERLHDRGYKRTEVDAILEPGRALLDDPRFWAHRSPGIAVFLSAGWSAAFRLPLELAESVVVGARLYLKPLFALFAGDGRFYLLALAQKGPALYRGSRHTLESVEVASLPRSLADALQPDIQQPQLRFEVPAPHHQGSRPDVFHGQSVGTYDPNDPIMRYFRTLDAALHELLRAESAPLVLAGVEYLWPLYRSANTYPHLLAEGVAGNPQGLRVQELQRRRGASSSRTSRGRSGRRARGTRSWPVARAPAAAMSGRSTASRM